MIADWRSYSAEQFVPFTPEVYFRLIERVNAAQWPLHLLVLLLVAAVFLSLLKGRGAPAGVALALLWVWAGQIFLARHYGELVWVGRWFAWAFVLQAMLLAVLGLLGKVRWPANAAVPEWCGFGIAAFGVLLYPLLAPLTGHEWRQAEMIGVHPDPTAAATLGLVLGTMRGAALWISSIVPVLWCLLSASTLFALGDWRSVVPSTIAVAAVTAVLWKTLSRPSTNEKR